MTDVKGKHVFLSGPMSGIDNCNVAGFATAHAIVKEAGAYEVYNPAIEYLCSDYKSAEKPHAYWMMLCLRELTRPRSEANIFGGGDDSPMYSVIVMLPGWNQSDGARTERMVAKACGIEVCELSEVGL